jgi:hypothetical protein
MVGGFKFHHSLFGILRFDIQKRKFGNKEGKGILNPEYRMLNIEAVTTP